MTYRTSFISTMVGVGFVIAWSSGFVGGRLATETSMPVLALFAWRFLLASALMFAFWLLLNRIRGDRDGVSLYNPTTWQDAGREAFIGALTMGGYLLGVILAIEAGVNPAIVALIAALQPLLAAAVAGRWLGERLPARGWAGMALATLGVVFCVLDDMSRQGGNVPLWAYALPLISVLSVTAGSVLAVRWSRARTLPITLTLTSQLCAATAVFGAAALVAAFWAGDVGYLAPALDTVTISALVWLIVLSSFCGYGFFIASLRRLGVTRTSVLVYLTPPVTLIWAAVMFGDKPGLAGVLGMLVASAGVILTLSRQRGHPSWGTERAAV